MSIERISASVEDIQVVETRGPWNSKSGGFLNVLLALSRVQTEAFLDYDNPEFERVQQESGVDIRGLRSYSVSKIPKGSIGGKEYHEARTEYVTAPLGAAVWFCVDRAGREKEFHLDGSKSVIMPPGILHTYEAQKDDTTLTVICNTLFVPEDPLTHDTYTREKFDESRLA